MSFNKIRQMKVAVDTTREFKLDGVDLGGSGVPTLVVRYAGDTNPPYWSAVLKLANEKRNRVGGKVTPNTIQEAREIDCRLFAKHVVVNWSNVYEDDGKGGVRLVEFDSAKCEEFLAAIAESASDVFALFRGFITDADNFRSTSAVDGAELGKP